MLNSEGTGGRVIDNGDWNPDDILAGLLTKDKSKLLPYQDCANPRCRKSFQPRADGDIYCSEACDLDNNPQWKGSQE